MHDSSPLIRFKFALSKHMAISSIYSFYFF